MINEKNASYLYVANTLNGIADEAVFDGMAAGSICLVRSGDNKNEESALGTTMCRIVQKKADGNFVFSPYFSSDTIFDKKKQAHVQPVEQVSIWGYDGTYNTTGFPTLVTGNTYTLHMVLNHTRSMYNNAPQIKTIPYKAQSTSQADLALGLQKQFLRTFSDTREFYPSIICDRISDSSAVAVLTGNATIYKVTKGSTTVLTYTKTASQGLTLTSDTASVTLGDIIHFPSSNGRTFTFTADILGTSLGSHTVVIGTTVYTIPDAGTAQQNADAIVAAINAGTQATATDSSSTTVTITYNDSTIELPPFVIKSVDDSTFTSVAVTISSGDSIPVKYKVAATTSTVANFELDVPWQGSTGYLYEGTSATTSNIGIATVTGYWGLKFTGIRQPFDPISDSLVNQKVYFDITSEDFRTTTEYKIVKMNPGVGTYESVSYKEIYSQFLDKDAITSKRPRTKYRQETINGNMYTLYSFRIKNNIQFEAIGQTVNSYANITLALKTSLTGDISAWDTILTVS